MLRTAAAFLLLLFPASAALHAQMSVAGAPVVALTFDDLPAHGPLAPGQKRSDVVNSILATLKAEELPPVYGFVNSFRMDDYPYQVQILRAWHDAGDPLGNHTYSHEELDHESVRVFGKDVLANEAVLRKLQPDADWHWFRYPYMEEGDTNEKRDAARTFLFAHQYKIAEVSIDFQDARWNDAYGLCSAARDEGGVQKLHDTYLAAADEAIARSRATAQSLYGRDIRYVALLHVGSFDARMLPELVALFRARGFTFVTLPDAMADPAYAEDAHFAVKGGSGFLEMTARARGVALPPPSTIPAGIDHICKLTAGAHIPAR